MMMALKAIQQQVKVKLSRYFNQAQYHEGILGSGGMAPCSLDLGTGWSLVVSFMPWPIYLQGKSHRYQLDRRLSGPQSQSGHGGEEKNSHLLPRIESPSP
jgi:hypothetical protein